MSDVKIEMVQQVPLERLPSYIGFCCREWELAYGHRGRCGLCGTVPTFPRHAEDPDHCNGAVLLPSELPAGL